MDFKFSKEAETKAPKQSGTAEKRRQNALLLLLLILVGGFSYLYFFTDIIRPQPAVQKPAETPAPQVVKKPLPPKVEPAPAGGDTKNPAAKAEAPKATPAPPPAAAPASSDTGAKPEPVKKSEAAKPAEKAPAPAPAAAQAPKQPAPVKAEAKPVAKPAVVAKAETKPAEKKAVAAPEKTVSTEVPKKAAGTKAVKQATTPKPAVKKAAESSSALGWTVVVGNYLLEDAMATDLARVRKAGFKAYIKPGARKKASMNRLFLGEFDSRGAARTELEKLKQYTADAFILDMGGKYAVYAGSYLLEARAASEKERLGAAGLNLVVKHSEVPIPSRDLTIGTYTDKAEAEAAVRKLKDAGLNATIVH